MQWMKKYCDSVNGGSLPNSYNPAQRREVSKGGKEVVKRSAPEQGSTANSTSQSLRAENPSTNVVASYKKKIMELKLSVDSLEKERDYYFSQLRNIEMLCQTPEIQDWTKRYQYIGLLKEVTRLSTMTLKEANASSVTAIANEKLKAEEANAGKKKTGNIDGVREISSLPTDVLIQILSRLPTLDAISTSMLSKRFKYLFPQTTRLEFDESNLLTPKWARHDKFKDLVDKSISVHRSPIDDFRFKTEKGFMVHEPTSWIEYALGHAIQVLHINACDCSGDFLPPCIFSSKIIARAETRIQAYVKLSHPCLLAEPKEVRAFLVLFNKRCTANCYCRVPSSSRTAYYLHM